MNSAIRLITLFAATFCCFSAFGAEPPTGLLKNGDPETVVMCGITATPTTASPACNGQSSGSITLAMAPVAGSSPAPTQYSYSFSGTNANGGGTITGSGGPFGFASPLVIGSLPAGNYTVSITITAPGGCTGAVVSGISISQPAAVGVSNSVTPNACTGGATGAISSTGSGGTGAYTFSFNGGAFFSQNSWTNLPAGSYTVQSQDANGCLSAVTTANVGTLQSAAVTVALSAQTNAACFDQTSGAATFSAGGGVSGPYQYSLSGTDHTSAPVSRPYQTGGTFSLLKAGTYTVTAKDGFGCGFPTANATITQPADFSYTPTVVPNACSGGLAGSISGAATGGPASGSYSYAWADGPTTQNRTALASGSYSVTVSKGGCSRAFSISVGTTNPAITITAAISNVLCNGATTGTINITAAGGSGVFTNYDWFDLVGASNPEDRGPLAAGTYTVTVTDNAGCTKAASFSVTQPATALTTTATKTDVLCFGQSTGAINLTASGGTGAYNYDWADVAGTSNSEDRTALVAGTYTVTVTDVNGCSSTLSRTIAQPGAALTINVPAPLSLACNGYSNGQISASSTGGTGAKSFVLTGTVSRPANGSGLFTGLPAGSYTVTVTDANGCTAAQAATISQPPVLVASLVSTTPTTCFGGSNGTVTLNISGGAGPSYQVSIDGGANQAAATGNNTFFSLTGGAHTATVTDINGCPAVSVSFSIASPPQMTVALVVDQQISCPINSPSYTSNGVLRAVVANNVVAVTSYTLGHPVVIGGPQPSDAFGGLGQGLYNVKATDANGCTAVSSQVFLARPLDFVESAMVTNVACFGGSNGAINITRSGGTTPYNFDWSNLAGTNNPEDQTALPGGSYTVTLTDAKGCTLATSYAVTAPSAPLNATASETDISCFGEDDGSINAFATGGTAPYQYSLDGVTFTVANNLPAPGNHTFFGLPPGTYTVTVRDATGICLDAATPVDIDEPSELILAGGTTMVSCNGGSNGQINATATGGAGLKNFRLFAQDGTTLLAGPQASGTFTGRPAGTYVVTVIDANGCSDAEFYILEQPTVLVSLAVGTNPSCNGSTNGTITATATGGVTAYGYTLYNGPTYVTGPQPMGVFSGLASGTYSVVVRDNNACTATSNSVTITAPAAFMASGSMSAPGTATLVFSGGNPPYTAVQQSCSGPNCTKTTVGSGTTLTFGGLAVGTYTWLVSDAQNCPVSPGNVTVVVNMGYVPLSGTASTSTPTLACNNSMSGQITVTAANGSGGYSYSIDGGTTFQGSGLFTGLSAGTYQPVVKDASSITATASPASITISTASAIAVSGNPTPVSCFGGSNGGVNIINITGGTAPFSFAWSNGASTQNIGSLAAGIYSVVVTDANGCTKAASWTVSEPSLLTASVVGAAATCSGGTALLDLTVGGGTSPFSYDWSNDGAEAVDNDPQDLTIGAGTFSVTVTDAGGCTAVASGTVTAPAAISLSTSTTPFTCSAMGSINLTASGGTGLLTFDWSNDGPDVPDNDPEDLSGLAAGTYTVTVTDANGCTNTTSATVANLSTVAVSAVPTSPLCHGQNNGSVVATASGGVSPFTFSLNGGAFGPGMTPTTASFAASANTYTVTAKDANGCTNTTSVVVTDPPVLTASATSTAATCFGSANGTVTASAVGGTGAHQFSLDGGAFQVSPSFSGVAAGLHSITAKDANGCTHMVGVTVTQPTAVAATRTSSIANCAGQIVASATGGTGAFTFSNNGGAYQASGTFSGLTTGTFTITAKDANGCTAAAASVTFSIPAVTATFSTAPASCNGAANGAVTLTAGGGTAPFEYSKDGGTSWQISPNFTNLPAGTYGVGVFRIRDANGCSVNLPAITVSQPTALTALITSMSNASCNASNGSATVAASGGTMAYSYLWPVSAASQTTATASALAQGSYTVTVTDLNGCTATATATIATTGGGGPLVVTGTDIFPVTCLNNGKITVLYTGCVSSVQWFMGATPLGGGTAVPGGNQIGNLPAGVNFKVIVTPVAGAATTISSIVVPNSSPTIDGILVDNTDCGVTISWKAKKNVDRYRVQRSNDGGATWVNYGAGCTTGTSLSGPVIPILQTYLFRVTYEVGGSCGAATCSGTPTQATGTYTRPFRNPPTNISAGANSNSSATVNWAQSCATTPASINLRYRVKGTVSWTTIAGIAGTATTHTLTGLMPGKTYEYQLQNAFVAIPLTSAWTQTREFILPTLLTGVNPTNMVSDGQAAAFEGSFSSENESFENAEDRAEKGQTDTEKGQKAQPIGLVLAPNPATEKVWLDIIRLVEGRPTAVQIRSLEGRLLRSETIASPRSHESLEVDVADLQPGIYFLEILQDGQRKTAKLIRQ